MRDGKDRPPEMLMETLRKVAALAESGIEGERQAAQRMLARLERLYGLSLAEMQQPTTSRVPFTLRDALDRALFCQVICYVTRTRRVRYWYAKGDKRHVAVDLTKAQAVDAVLCLAHYRAAWRAELPTMMEAFINAQRLFSGAPADEAEPEPELTAEERARLKRLHLMAMGMSCTPWQQRPLLAAAGGGA